MYTNNNKTNESAKHPFSVKQKTRDVSARNIGGVLMFRKVDKRFIIRNFHMEKRFFLFLLSFCLTFFK